VQRWCSRHGCANGCSRPAGPRGQLMQELAAPDSDTGAWIDRRLCFPLSACLSADPDGDRHAETCHSVKHIAPDFRLDPLIGQKPRVKSSADDGLVAKHRGFNQTPAIIAGTSLPAQMSMLRNGREWRRLSLNLHGLYLTSGRGK